MSGRYKGLSPVRVQRTRDEHRRRCPVGALTGNLGRKKPRHAGQIREGCVCVCGKVKTWVF